MILILAQRREFVGTQVQYTSQMGSTSGLYAKHIHFFKSQVCTIFWLLDLIEMKHDIEYDQKRLIIFIGGDEYSTKTP